MSDTKISALPAAASALGTDELPINEAGASKKLTVAQIQTLIMAGAQPLDSDLTAIAALATTAYGRAFLALTNAAALAALLAATGDTAWTGLSMVNSWVNFGGVLAPAGYRKDGFGIVRLRGRIKSGSDPSVCTLPAGYRPGYTHGYATVANDIFGAVAVTGGGVLYVYGSNLGVDLDCVWFYAGG